jgi:DNA-binding NarL/FixJ family response regulator
VGDARTLGPIFVVDDDTAIRRLLAKLLDQAGYTTREFATALTAVDGMREERPELAIVEVCLPDMTGYEVCRQLRDLFGDALPVIFVSADRVESIDRVAGLLVGGDDYIVKPFAPDELLARVRALIRRATPPSPPLPTVGSDLTKRELEVLRLLVEGLEQSEIAERLVISPKTASTHTQNIFRKLGVRNRAQAVAAAYQLDLVVAPATA